jgi:hypothetical protein
MKHIYLLQNGATVLGVYSSEALATEACAEWCDEFTRRLDRAPRLTEMPVVHKMLVNGIPMKSVVVMEGAN